MKGNSRIFHVFFQISQKRVAHLAYLCGTFMQQLKLMKLVYFKLIWVNIIKDRAKNVVLSNFLLEKSEIVEKICVRTLPQKVTMSENVSLGVIYQMKYSNLILQFVSTEFLSGHNSPRTRCDTSYYYTFSS